MKFNIIVADPPYSFGDKLSMSDVKRGADAQYATMPVDKIKEIPVNELAADDALLVLWVPSSMLQDGLDIMKNWGFEQRQSVIWVKTKQEPLKDITLFIKQAFKLGNINLDTFENIAAYIKNFDLNSALGFNMGRIFRNCHEIVLIGIRGNIYKLLKNKAQRTVIVDGAKFHSAKTEILQDRLDIMFSGDDILKLELFARRQRPGYTCVGLEMPLSESVLVSIERLKSLP